MKWQAINHTTGSELRESEWTCTQKTHLISVYEESKSIPGYSGADKKKRDVLLHQQYSASASTVAPGLVRMTSSAECLTKMYKKLVKRYQDVEQVHGLSGGAYVIGTRGYPSAMVWCRAWQSLGLELLLL